MAGIHTTVAVPARPDNVRVLRVVAADAAAAADLRFDRYSDLELAVSEASAMLLSRHPADLVCALEHRPGVVSVELTARGEDDPSADLDELSLMVLEATTDEFSTNVREGAHVIRFSICNDD